MEPTARVREIRPVAAILRNIDMVVFLKSGSV
jgi:hypothetical protein